MTDYKQLCADLADDLELADWPSKLKEAFRSDIDRARAALTEPEPEGPTDDELDELFTEIDQSGEPESWRAYARAVLARWGNHPGSPDSSTQQLSDGEVVELVAWLRRSTGCADESPMDLRAADLLERLSPPRLAAEPPSPEQGQVFKDADTGVIYVRDGDQWLATQPVPQPVSVAERLPGPEDCDAEGLCWVWNTTAYTWGLFRLDLTVHSHWLPAHALPLPSSGEGKA